LACRQHVSKPKSTIDLRTFSSDNTFKTSNEFLKRLRALGKLRNVSVDLDAARVKGSHQTVYFDAAFTVLRKPKDE